MKKIIECDIKSFSHEHYIFFDKDQYKISNKKHYHGDLCFKFDDSKLKKVKYISKEDKLKDIHLKSKLEIDKIMQMFAEPLEDFYKENTSKFISSLIGDSVVEKLGKFFYNKSNKVTKKIHKVENAIKTKNYAESSSWLLVDLSNKHIEVLIDFSSLKENFEKDTQLYLQNKERYLREGWNWSESKIEEIKKKYQNNLLNYKNLITISKSYNIKLDFILNDVKECEFSCEFKENKN